MSLRRKLALVGVAATLATIGGLGLASPAFAAPSGCSSYIASDGRGYGRCLSGTGEYRVGIACKGIVNFGYGFSQYGNWASPSGEYLSVAKCPTGSWNWAPSGGSFQSWIETR